MNFDLAHGVRRISGFGVDPDEFAPEIVKAQARPPSPLPRAVLRAVLVLLALLLAWAVVGRLDVVAVSEGRLVPQGSLKIVQPAEPGIVREILVREGDAVQAGQVLARMDARLAEADLRALATELARRDLQLRRIDAELADTTIRPKSGDDPVLYSQAEAQHRSRRQAHLDALGAERAALARARQDLRSAIEVEGKLRRTAPIHAEQARAWDQLAREGFAGRLMALDRERAHVEAQQDLLAQGHVIAGLAAAIEQSEKRIAQIDSNYRRELHAERAEAAAGRARLAEEDEKQRHRHGLLELKAPQAGVVKDLATHTPGTVVAPGTILLTLVPLDEPLVVEAWVRHADAGLVQVGQRARVKLAAYPFQKHGMLDGTVRQLSADAHEQRSANGAPPREAAYRALIDLETGYLDRAGRRLRLVPGMVASAEIHLGSRTVLEYLLSPIERIAHEAGRER
ncbi:MAG: HlyD family type I secretion periplasmic adaptor subunit [Burkholderiales bacterium]|nr:HlyD family type I secretion periplasmic adaptor subunit [Burkholderiales bacterium]